MHKLDILLDPALSWDSQIAAVSRSAFTQCMVITQPRPYLVRTLAQALVISRIDYCNALYMGLALGLNRRLVGLKCGSGGWV